MALAVVDQAARASADWEDAAMCWWKGGGVAVLRRDEWVCGFCAVGERVLF